MKDMKTRSTGQIALENGIHMLFFLCGMITVGFVLCISAYLIISGLPAILKIGAKDFFLGSTWMPTATTTEASYGILPFILTSIYGTAGAVLIGVPIGLLTAVFLSKIAPPKVARTVSAAVQMLAGIPSVVYGLVGMIVLVPATQEIFHLSSGATLAAAIIVLSIMILPSIINVSETALRAVPREYEEASQALGATKLETYFRVSIPAAKSGIATAVVLGVGRAIGEAMAIIMVSGNVANMPRLFGSVRFMTTAIASEMGYAAVGSLQQPVARDLRTVSAAMKMVTDIERIGDQSADLAEIIAMGHITAIPKTLPMEKMALSVIKMVTDSIDSFVSQDEDEARAVLRYDDVVDGCFNECKAALIALLQAAEIDGEAMLDLLMISKYFERIGDHAVNIAKWVIFSVTGTIVQDEHAAQTD